MIYLINLPAYFLINDRNNMPLGMLYLVAMLRSHNIAVSIIDLAGLREDKWQIPLDGNFYGISATTPQYPIACKIAQYLKKQNGDSSQIIIGGSHATALPEEVLQESCFDIAVIGEGEETLLEIVEGKLIDTINGIAYKTERGNIQVNPIRPIIKNLDSLPYPNPLELDLQKYNCQIFSSRDGRGIRGIDVITSRGCCYQCAFCASVRIWQHTIRFHSANYVIRYLDYMRMLGYNNFYFVDDFFILARKDIDLILKDLELHESTFRCLLRSDYITHSLVQKLYKSGCRQIDIGVESGSQKILDRIHKGVSVKQNLQAIQFCREANISCKVFLIIGLPEESQETIDETIHFLKEANPDLVSINLFVPYPGTPIWENPEAYRIFIDKNKTFDKYLMGGTERILEPVHSNREELLIFQRKIIDFLGNKDINLEIQSRMIK